MHGLAISLHPVNNIAATHGARTGTTGTIWRPKTSSPSEVGWLYVEPRGERKGHSCTCCHSCLPHTAGGLSSPIQAARRDRASPTSLPASRGPSQHRHTFQHLPLSCRHRRPTLAPFLPALPVSYPVSSPPILCSTSEKYRPASWRTNYLYHDSTSLRKGDNAAPENPVTTPA